jgi:catechol 2,3-dioxygenase-like lactoylglutathione lyase family enzyme
MLMYVKRIMVYGAVALALCQNSFAQTSELNPLHLSFHHVTASVNDLETEAAWYERVLGFKRSALLGDTDDFRMYQMTMPGYRIDLVQQKGSVRQRAQGASGQGWLHIVFQSSDLSTAYKYLQSRGTDVQAKKEGGAVVHLTLHDPEENEIGIAHE